MPGLLETADGFRTGGLVILSCDIERTGQRHVCETNDATHYT